MVFGAVILITAICGVIIVAGGIALLWKGAITLAATSPSDALTIEWQKRFKLSTQVPGIAFFVIGLCFVITALYAADPPKGTPVDLQGEVDGVDAPVTVILRSEPTLSRAYQGGKIKFKFYPDMSILTLEASAPGYEPASIPIEIGTETHVVFPRLQLKKRIDEIKAKPASIEPVAFQAPPVTDTTSNFGTPR